MCKKKKNTLRHFLLPEPIHSCTSKSAVNKTNNIKKKTHKAQGAGAAFVVRRARHVARNRTKTRRCEWGLKVLGGVDEKPCSTKTHQKGSNVNGALRFWMRWVRVRTPVRFLSL